MASVLGKLFSSAGVKLKSQSGKFISHKVKGGHAAMNVGFQVLLPFLMAPKGEKFKMGTEGAIGWWMTSAFLSPGKQMLWGTLFSMSGSFASMSRSVVSGYRGAMESRTMAAIPFSYGSGSMDQALMSLQYTRQRMSELSYGQQSRVHQDLRVGAEAQMYSARYLSK